MTQLRRSSSPHDTSQDSNPMRGDDRLSVSVMRIGVLASKTGTTPRALRYYEEQGLIFSERSPGGQREYHPDTVERVRFVQDLLAAGLPSRVIATVLPCLRTHTLTGAQHLVLETEHRRMTSRIESLRAAQRRLSDLIASSRLADDVDPSSVRLRPPVRTTAGR